MIIVFDLVFKLASVELELPGADYLVSGPVLNGSTVY